MRNTNFHQLILLVLAPAIPFAGRYLYSFEIFLIAPVLLVLLKSIRLDKLTLSFLVSLFAISFIAVYVQGLLWGAVISGSLSRFVLLCYPLALWSYINNDNFDKAFNVVAWYTSLLAISQFIDGYLLSSYFSVNALVGLLYPYAGELSERSLGLSNGVQISVSSFNSATSIADGQSILLGDFLSIILVYSLYKRSYMASFFVFFALLITFSRGSWLMGCVGILGIFLVSSRREKASIAKIVGLSSVVLYVALTLNESIYYAFFYRVMNTLAVFDLSAIQVGTEVDPRTAVVWPNFLAGLSDAGFGGAFVGFPYDGPTDSGFLAIIRESGIIGLFVFFLLAMFIVFRTRFDPISLVMLAVLFVGMIFHPIQQGSRTVFFTAMFFAARIHATSSRRDNG